MSLLYTIFYINIYIYSSLFIPSGILDSQTSDSQWQRSVHGVGYGAPNQQPFFLPDPYEHTTLDIDPVLHEDSSRPSEKCGLPLTDPSQHERFINWMYRLGSSYKNTGDILLEGADLMLDMIASEAVKNEDKDGEPAVKLNADSESGKGMSRERPGERESNEDSHGATPFKALET